MKKIIILALLLPVNANALTYGFKNGFGTAITSLKHNGIEYLDSSDHGRNLQSAISFDGKGECYNPTEAGSWYKAKRQNSSKVVYKSKLYSLEYMGWWYNPGDTCINEGGIAKYPLSSATSDYLLAKKYQVKGNILDLDVSFYSPRTHETATFEALTAYVPSWPFTKIERYDPVGKISYPYSHMGEDRYPVIISSSSSLSAIGIYSYELPEYYGPDLVGYGAFNFPYQSVNKLNCVFRRSKIKADSVHSFNCKIIVGTLNEVKLTMSKLENYR